MLPHHAMNAPNFRTPELTLVMIQGDPSIVLKASLPSHLSFCFVVPSLGAAWFR